MSIFSFKFIVLVIIALILYYIFPKKFQWIVLLLTSTVFYSSMGWKSCVYICFTSLSVYLCTMGMDKISTSADIKVKSVDKTNKAERKRIRELSERRRKYLLLFALLSNVGILAYVKYLESILTFINNLAHTNLALRSMLVPVGISFYTFTAIGYLVDVYMEKIEAERNYLKLLLFISFFPSIIQGPINRFKEHGSEFFKEHEFDIDKFEKGLVLILWGMLKKLVIADRIIVGVQTVLDSPDAFAGWQLVMGLLIYSVWQYTDFSGGIDIVTGVAELFGVKIAENFKRPYFSESLSEFWRRWHISLGAWMKDYVFYPLALSDGAKVIKKKIGRVFSEDRAPLIVMGLCNLVVFLLVGIWHGPYWHYVLWGLYNGVIIATSTILDPTYDKWRKLLHINPEAKWYKCFKIIRTFVIINIGWIFDYCDSWDKIGGLFRGIFTRIGGISINQESIFSLGLTNNDWIILLFSVFVIFVVSLLGEKGMKVRDKLFGIALPIRWILLYLLIFFVAAHSVTGGAAFLYAQF